MDLEVAGCRWCKALLYMTHGILNQIQQKGIMSRLLMNFQILPLDPISHSTNFLYKDDCIGSSLLVRVLFLPDV